MKKLEELLNLPEKASTPSQLESDDIEDRHMEYDEIIAALPQVKGLGDLADKELDDLAVRATNAYDELFALGMSVEPRFSGRIFEVASSMLKNAIDAKTVKLDKKLKMIELQLKKQRLDEYRLNNGNSELTGTGTIVADRNSLLAQFKNNK